MAYNDDLFGDIENVAQPEKLDSSFYSDSHNNETFFKNFNNVEIALNDIQDNLNDMHELYNELGSGNISNNLSIQRRNEIIETLGEYQENITLLTAKLNQYVENDLTSVRGLQVTTSTDINAFDKLLNKNNNKKLTSKEVSFQRSK